MDRRERPRHVCGAAQVPVQACSGRDRKAPADGGRKPGRCGDLQEGSRRDHEQLRNVDNEAAARREAYEKQAEVEKQQLLADARKQADAIVAAGKASAEAERQSKLREADAQTTALARAMCEKLLARNLTAQDDARLLDDLLEKAGAGNGN